MHLDRRLLGWGVFFILLGAVPLALRAGLVSDEVVGRWPTLWPVLLIGWGVGLILRATPLEWIGGAITAITFGLMGGGAIASGFVGLPTFGNCTGDGQVFAAQEGSLGTGGDLSIDLSCGMLSVTTVEGSRWAITGTDRDGRPPNVAIDPNGAVRITTASRAPEFGGARATWDVTLPRAPHLRLGVTLSAGDGAVDLLGTSLDALSASLNAGSLGIDLTGAAALPTEGLTASVNAGTLTIALPRYPATAHLSVNAGTLRVCVPTDSALRVHWSGAVASNDLDESGLVQAGDNTWTTPGFNAGAAHTELEVNASAGSFQLRRGGTCGA